MEAQEDTNGHTAPSDTPLVSGHGASGNNERPPLASYDSLYRSLHVPSGAALDRTGQPGNPLGRISLDRTSYDRFDGGEKRSEDYSGTGSSESLESDSPITWHYLTYDTTLPAPSRKGDDAPEPPDLVPYENPLTWSPMRKLTLVWLSCFATSITAYGAGMYVPGIDQIAPYFEVSRVQALVGVTMFTAGFAVAPMVMAPFSELTGRRPMFLITGFLFFGFVLCCAFTHLYAGMLIARFLAGAASSTFSTMVGGVVSDIYAASERNTAMTLFTGGALFGTGIGPMVSGFIAYHMSWRWMFYVHAMVVFANAILLLLFFKETRGPVLLSRKAKKLNQWYEAREQAGYVGFEMLSEKTSKKESQRIRWKVKSDEERASILQMIKISLVRPLHMLFTEPVVFFFSLWISFAWSVLYSTFSVVPYMFEVVHGFNLQQSNAIFAALSIGAILAAILSIYQERIAAKFGKSSNTPEGRLYYACVESIMLPIGLFWFGWTSSADIPWIVPTLAVSCATMGIFSVYLAVFNYLADCYGPYASSAIAAQSFCRNLMGGAFPLFTQQMYDGLGFGPGGSLMGGIAVILTLVPWILVFYGPRIRARSKFASQIMKG